MFRPLIEFFMAKRQLSSSDQFDLQQTLHVAVLEALMASRRWEPNDLAFQGGTSLHLVHGSPRFSEDLDFLLRGSIDVNRVGTALRDRILAQHPNWVPPDMKLGVKIAKAERNPYLLTVSVQGDNVIGAVKVKLEFWQAHDSTMGDLAVEVSPVRVSASGVNAAQGFQTFVPTADPREIYADKVFALAARPYLKPRDLFDLYWLSKHHKIKLQDLGDKEMRARFAFYPNETVTGWMGKAHDRLSSLPQALESVRADLQRWLPSSWPLDAPRVREMIDLSCQALQRGMDLVSAWPETSSTDQESFVEPVPEPTLMEVCAS